MTEAFETWLFGQSAAVILLVIFIVWQQRQFNQYRKEILQEKKENMEITQQFITLSVLFEKRIDMCDIDRNKTSERILAILESLNNRL